MLHLPLAILMLQLLSLLRYTYSFFLSRCFFSFSSYRLCFPLKQFNNVMVFLLHPIMFCSSASHLLANSVLSLKLLFSFCFSPFIFFCLFHFIPLSSQIFFPSKLSLYTFFYFFFRSHCFLCCVMAKSNRGQRFLLDVNIPFIRQVPPQQQVFFSLPHLVLLFLLK